MLAICPYFLYLERKKIRLLRARTIENGSFIKTDHEWERIQDAGLIVEKAKGFLDGLLAESGGACAIGLTGQMHGILYVDKKGVYISPLYTWQDGRGNIPGPGGKSLVEEIYEKYQVKTASGYGLATHLYHIRKCREDILCKKRQGGASDLVQECTAGEAAALCTIADYFGMTLTGRRRPLMHTSMADSLGFFDGEKGVFLKGKLREVEDTFIGPLTAPRKAVPQMTGGALESPLLSLLPEVTKELAVLGKYRGIQVTAALGDSQAGFLGSVGMEEGTLLVNMGTGGQISALCGSYFKAPGIEARPYLNGKYLLTGASLCGGRAYAILENFFGRYLRPWCAACLRAWPGSCLICTDRFKGERELRQNALWHPETGFGKMRCCAGYLAGCLRQT